MIDLNNHPKFQQDIQSKNTYVYPIVIINEPLPHDSTPDFGNSILISTVTETLRFLYTDINDQSQSTALNFKDYGLKISNIKESIDIRDSKFKISNVTLTLSNYEIDGIRLSDYIKDTTKTNVSG